MPLVLASDYMTCSALRTTSGTIACTSKGTTARPIGYATNTAGTIASAQILAGSFLRWVLMGILTPMGTESVLEKFPLLMGRANSFVYVATIEVGQLSRGVEAPG